MKRPKIFWRKLFNTVEICKFRGPAYYDPDMKKFTAHCFINMENYHSREKQRCMGLCEKFERKDEV